MRLPLSNIRLGRLLPLLTLCLGLSSCVYDDGTMADEPEVPAESYMVVFSMRLRQAASGVDAMSRGGDNWGDESDPDRIDGDDAVDNYVDIDGTLRVGVYDAEGKLAAQVRRVITYSGMDADDKIAQTRHYECRGVMELTDDAAAFPNGGDYTVMLFINTPGTDNLPATLDAAKTLEYSRYGSETAVSNAGGIPMWGFTTSNLAGIKQGKSYELGDIYMLRAMSKVKVFVNADSEKDGWKIKSLTVSNINEKGYSMPLWTKGADKGTTDLKLAASLRPHGSNMASLPEYDYEKSPTGRFVFYMPEKKNTADAQKCRMDVVVSNGTSEITGTIEFKRYTADGAPTDTLLDIIRNHYYSFEILCGEDENLRFKVTIADMEKGGDYVFDY